MKITGYYKPEKWRWFIPSKARTDADEVSDPSSHSARSTIFIPREFELPEGSWFAVIGDQIVRYPRSREPEFLNHRVHQVLNSLDKSNVEDTYQKLTDISNLLGVDFAYLIDKLNQEKSGSQSYAEIFRDLILKKRF